MVKVYDSQMNGRRTVRVGVCERKHEQRKLKRIDKEWRIKKWDSCHNQNVLSGEGVGRAWGALDDLDLTQGQGSPYVLLKFRFKT